jgi:hypothetical protein
MRRLPPILLIACLSMTGCYLLDPKPQQGTSKKETKKTQQRSSWAKALLEGKNETAKAQRIDTGIKGEKPIEVAPGTSYKIWFGWNGSSAESFFYDVAGKFKLNSGGTWATLIGILAIIGGLVMAIFSPFGSRTAWLLLAGAGGIVFALGVTAEECPELLVGSVLLMIVGSAFFGYQYIKTNFLQKSTATEKTEIDTKAGKVVASVDDALEKLDSIEKEMTGRQAAKFIWDELLKYQDTDVKTFVDRKQGKIA